MFFFFVVSNLISNFDSVDALPPKLSAAAKKHPQLLFDWHIVEITPAVDVSLVGSGSTTTVEPAQAGEYTVPPLFYT